jgi:hypothetical protein
MSQGPESKAVDALIDLCDLHDRLTELNCENLTATDEIARTIERIDTAQSELVDAGFTLGELTKLVLSRYEPAIVN